MKLLGLGLSKTGTTSLHRALGILGLRSLHYDRRRLNHVVRGTNLRAGFRCYDDVDAVLDLPAAFFFEELLAAYPECRGILTVRDEDAWWRSISAHFNGRARLGCREDDPFKWDLRSLVYGSPHAEEAAYRARYRAHNERVRRSVPPERLLVVDIAGGDGWDRLCPFLGLAIPDVPFPHQNTDPAELEAARAAARAALAKLAVPGTTFVLVDEGWLGVLPRGCRTLAFVEREGVDWGLPADDQAAISELERQRRRGASHLVFAWPAFWWLDHYRGLAAHLDAQFPRILDDDRLVAFDLRQYAA